MSDRKVYEVSYPGGVEKAFLRETYCDELGEVRITWASPNGRELHALRVYTSEPGEEIVAWLELETAIDGIITKTDNICLFMHDVKLIRDSLIRMIRENTAGRKC